MTKEDELLMALGDEAKARDAEDERWWQAVESRDASGIPSEDPAHLDALRPLDSAEMDGIAAFLLGEAPAAKQEAPAVEPEGAKVISIFKARRWVAPFGATIAAAAVALFMVRPPIDESAQYPRYSLEVRSGEKPTRGPDDGQPQVGVTLYSDGALFDFVLVPDTSLTAEDTVALRAVIVDAAGGAKAWDAPSERLQGGTFRVRGQIGQDLQLEPGAYQLVFFVGAPSSLEKDLTAASQAPPAGVQRFAAPIELR